MVTPSARAWHARVLLYELNEVPWRVLDDYAARHPGSHCASMLGRSAQYTTHTIDDGELSPWISWPTVHRGVSVHRHGIRFLNQNVGAAAGWPPLWEIAQAAGRRIGLFAPLQSFPPCKGPAVDFHVPDTFAPLADTVPPSLERLQRFNLIQSGADKASATRPTLHAMWAAWSALATRQIGRSSVEAMAQQLWREARDPAERGLRPIVQGVVGFDAFQRLLARYRPDYVSFFTNHVASVMHRYWRGAYPQDFASSGDSTSVPRAHAEAIHRAMSVVDGQIGWLMRFCERENYDLVVASALGQAAIDRGRYAGELMIESAHRLFSAMGLPAPRSVLPAMQPDATIETQTSQQADRLVDQLGRLRDPEGAPVIVAGDRPQSNRVNLKLRKAPAAVEAGVVHLDGHSRPLRDLGLKSIHRDPGTAYHIPQGILVWHPRGGLSDTESARRPVVDSRRIMSTVLERLGVPWPGYAMTPIDPLPWQGATVASASASTPVDG